MRLTVRLFARAKDLAGRDAVTLTMPDGATAGDLRRRLEAEYPALAGLVERSALAVNAEFAEDSSPLLADADVALLPPVSGG